MEKISYKILKNFGESEKTFTDFQTAMDWLIGTHRNNLIKQLNQTYIKKRLDSTNQYRLAVGDLKLLIERKITITKSKKTIE
jgi:hypothetical protein